MILCLKVVFYNEYCELSGGAFLAAVAGISAFVGFSATLAAAKKTDPKYFNKGMLKNKYLSF